jgi:hypothetical protein
VFNSTTTERTIWFQIEWENQFLNDNLE